MSTSENDGEDVPSVRKRLAADGDRSPEHPADNEAVPLPEPRAEDVFIAETVALPREHPPLRRPLDNDPQERGGGGRAPQAAGRAEAGQAGGEEGGGGGGAEQGRAAESGGPGGHVEGRKPWHYDADEQHAQSADGQGRGTQQTRYERSDACY